MSTINIKGLNKVALLAALFNASKQQGMGFLDRRGAVPMSEEQAAEVIKATPSMYFDYLYGRVMKVNISGDELFTGLYNRDNGSGAAECVVQKLIKESAFAA